MMESIWIDKRVEVVYYAWFGRDHIAYVLDKLRAGISSDYERYDYAINRKANNKAFLERVPDMIAEGYEHLENDLAGLLASYVKRMANDRNTGYINKYYYDWLTTTKMLCANYPAIVTWCEQYWTFLNGDEFSIIGKEMDEPLVMERLRNGDYGTVPVSPQRPDQAIRPQAIETEPANNESVANEPSPQPEVIVDEDRIHNELKGYFVASFQGIGNGNIDFYSTFIGLVVGALKAGKDSTYFGRVARMVYESDHRSPKVKQLKFAQWLSVFFAVIDRGVPRDKRKAHYEPTKGLKETYICLS